MIMNVYESDWSYIVVSICSFISPVSVFIRLSSDITNENATIAVNELIDCKYTWLFQNQIEYLHIEVWTKSCYFLQKID